MNNRKVWNNLRDFIPQPYALKDAHFFIEMCQGQQPAQNYAITLDGEVAGGIGCVRQPDVERVSVEIGYWLGEPFWGRGIGTTAVSLWLDYLYGIYPEAHRIFAGVYSSNPASMRVLQKNGFRSEGIWKEAILKNGALLDVHLYAILRPEWKKQRPER